MHLNHLNLTVSELSETREFFEEVFGFKCIVSRGNALVVLVDDAGFSLTLNQFKKVAEFSYPDDFNVFHVGFQQPSRGRVDEIHGALTAAGYEPPAIREYHGAWTFYLRVPGGFFVEVFYQQRMDR